MFLTEYFWLGHTFTWSKNIQSYIVKSRLHPHTCYPVPIPLHPHTCYKHLVSLFKSYFFKAQKDNILVLCFHCLPSPKICLNQFELNALGTWLYCIALAQWDKDCIVGKHRFVMTRHHYLRAGVKERPTDTLLLGEPCWFLSSPGFSHWALFLLWHSSKKYHCESGDGGRRCCSGLLREFQDFGEALCGQRPRCPAGLQQTKAAGQRWPARLCPRREEEAADPRGEGPATVTLCLSSNPLWFHAESPSSFAIPATAEPLGMGRFHLSCPISGFSFSKVSVFNWNSCLCLDSWWVKGAFTLQLLLRYFAVLCGGKQEFADREDG